MFLRDVVHLSMKWTGITSYLLFDKLTLPLSYFHAGQFYARNIFLCALAKNNDCTSAIGPQLLIFVYKNGSFPPRPVGHNVRKKIRKCRSPGLGF